MGFSVSATIAIFFIAFLAIGSSIYHTTYGTLHSLSNSIREQHEMMMNTLQTSISIASISVAGESSDYDLVVIVENKGSVTLDPSKLSILIDGVLQVNNLNNSAWFPKQSITIRYEHLSSSIGDHRIKIVTENGVSAYGTYSTR